MKEQLQVVVLTIVVFGAGLLTGVWTQRSRPVPPPPMAVMGEFHGLPHLPPWGGAMGTMRWMARGNRQEIARRLAQLRPQFEAFRSKVEAIQDDYHKSLEAILTPAQQAKLAARPLPPKPPELPALPPDLPEPPPGMPGPPPGMPGPSEELGGPFVGMIIYQPVLQFMAGYLDLNPGQREQLKQLLIKRRQNLLDLVDATPPPSLMLDKVWVDGN